MSVYTVSFRTSRGKIRRIRLYECWLNMHYRTRGKKTRSPEYWKGVTVGFKSWPEFRAWAIANGYRRGVQLDRINPTRGYEPGNCQWLTPCEHIAKSMSRIVYNDEPIYDF